MSSLPVTPRKELGQHFLVDENILHVIERLAGLERDDVVLEIGAGLGILTSYLADRVSVVHAVEVDRTLVPHLRSALASHPNARLTLGDALDLQLGALEPPATKLVANLPYSIATPIVVESLDGLPEVVVWCVMVQREVADRLVARAGTRAYGAVSVLVQLTSERTGFHPVARSCFRPPPNVDSALVALRRRRSWGPEYGSLKRVVQGGFSHRRKTLANALELSGVASRAEAVHALRELGCTDDARAESLEPEAFLALAAALP